MGHRFPFGREGERRQALRAKRWGFSLMQLPRMTTRRWLIAVAVAAVIAAGVDWAVIGAAFLIVIHAARRPQPVHRTTAVLLTLVAVILLWANLRPGPWEAEFGGVNPPELDVVTRAMFWRGWPLSPCMFCLFRPEKTRRIARNTARTQGGPSFALRNFRLRTVARCTISSEHTQRALRDIGGLGLDCGSLHDAVRWSSRRYEPDGDNGRTTSGRAGLGNRVDT